MDTNGLSAHRAGATPSGPLSLVELERLLGDLSGASARERERVLERVRVACAPELERAACRYDATPERAAAVLEDLLRRYSPTPGRLFGPALRRELRSALGMLHAQKRS